MKSWLSILESSFVVSLLPAYSASPSKRLAKSPKLYFGDTGLLCHLLGIQGESQLAESDELGLADARLQVVYGGDGTFSDGDVSVSGIREWLT